MGKDRLVDKTIRPLTTLTSVTPADVTGGTPVNQWGFLPIGNYKGAAAFLDLDKLANQPLVWAEQKHILGILDGREPGYDIVTVNVPTTTVATTVLPGTLTVPAGEVWYISCVQMDCPGDATAGFTLNWHCSLWTDRVGAAAAGQPYRTAAAALAGANTHTAPLGGVIQQLDEFGEIAQAFSVDNKVPLLRLPAGAIITFTVLVDTALPTAIAACSLILRGTMGKVLVAP